MESCGGTNLGSIRVSDETAVVETTAGRLRGYVSGDIYTFKGVSYGDHVGRERRFLPPAKPQPWSGVRSAMFYGPVCPQTGRYRYVYHDEMAFILAPRYGYFDEDCLRVNIWTPGLGRGASRPVMVWLHGGGCNAWSGQYLSCFHGENLSRNGDVVVVAVNHRLGALGFLNLAEYGGPEYKYSGNAGTLDLILALEWIRDNIAEFGGDPRNVTIFGQSGGGSKIGALMGMPGAQGLFHKAIVMSGTTRGTISAENAAKVAAGVMTELGLGAGQIDCLKTISTESLLNAADIAVDKLEPKETPPGGFYPSPWEYGWGPVVDGSLLPDFPFASEAPACSADVPLLIGTVLNECMPPFFSRELEEMTEDDLRARLEPACASQTSAFIEKYRRLWPCVKPVELMSIMYSTYVRRTAVSWAERKAAQNAASSYLYWFTWHTPVFDGRPRSFHCLDIPFAFNNTDRCAAMTGGGGEARELAEKMSGAFISFAQTGSPYHQKLPSWPEFDIESGSTMIFDSVCEWKGNPDSDVRALFREALRSQPLIAT